MTLRGAPLRTGLAAALLAVACAEGSDGPQAGAAQRGEQVYRNVCIACHASDPTQPGSLGPPLAGASQELLEAKLLRGEYPPGYTPQRPSRAMPRLEYLKDAIPDLAAYLARPR
jgi:mono/diheme cytochrome c family protein